MGRGAPNHKPYYAAHATHQVVPTAELRREEEPDTFQRSDAAGGADGEDSLSGQSARRNKAVRLTLN
jgi:hypothetical protein